MEGIDEEYYLGLDIKVRDRTMLKGYFEELKNVVSMAESRGLANYTLASSRFLLLNFNDYQNNLESGIPAEMGAVVFSLEKGIIKQYSTLFDPRLKTLEGTAETKDLITSHGLPPPVFENMYEEFPRLKDCSTGDCGTVLSKLKSLMMYANEQVILPYRFVCFALRKDLQIAKKCLDWIKAEELNDLLNVKVYALEELMTALFLASKFEERDPFTFRINRYRLSKPDLSHYRNFIELACPWHQQKDFQSLISKCSLHQCKDQAYRFMQGLLAGFSIKPKKSVHYPDYDDKGKILNLESIDDDMVGLDNTEKSQDVSMDVSSEMPAGINWLSFGRDRAEADTSEVPAEELQERFEGLNLGSGTVGIRRHNNSNDV